MPGEETVTLPGTVVAATSDDGGVWLAAAGRLIAFDGAGAVRVEVDAPDGLSALAGTRGMLAAALEPGVVAWLDGATGSVLARYPVGPGVSVVGGGGALWAFDRRSERAWRLGEPGMLEGPVVLRGVDRLAPDGDRLWWTSREDTVLRTADRAVDLGVGPDQRGAIVACAGSIWISIADALLRVGAWGGELGRPFPAPVGPVGLMVCAHGVLAGGSDRTLFVLDPSVDADVRVVDAAIEGELGFLVATASTVWAIPAGGSSARIVRVRPGA
jgi:hypothetical protein